ncbi:unnamed protein product [Protopolystoma xenopodis]|uniref:Glutamate synthase central-N domain-containing protein n=1 Tax=Protopolystoma xenopodis TaxID=117903 RepID=A0A448WT89_9PLAT|nr:unnamed protein product [Protopolystoma xenopodis]
MAKMGISTLQSYKSAQIFEAVGLSQSVIDKCFVGTASRIGGANFDVLAHEIILRHQLAYSISPSIGLQSHQSEEKIGLPIENPGFYHWRSGGENHMNDPDTIAYLQVSGDMIICQT